MRGRRIAGGKNMKGDIPQHVTKQLKKRRNACYILITCEEPSIDGKMQVEMTYKGDFDLASYLVENAQLFFNQQIAAAEDF
jgi:hypothetical protein